MRVEIIDRLVLVRTQVPAALGVQLDLVRGARGVPGEVFCRPSELQQFLFELAARPCLHDVSVGSALLEQQRRDLAGSGDLREHCGVGGCQREGTIIRSLDDQAAIATHGLGDVDRHRLRYGEFGILLERRDHALGVVAGRARIPQPEAGDAVGVDVLGRALEFGEDGKIVPGVFRVGVGHLQQHGAVGLDYKGTVRGRIHPVSLVCLAGSLCQQPTSARS